MQRDNARLLRMVEDLDGEIEDLRDFEVLARRIVEAHDGGRLEVRGPPEHVEQVRIALREMRATLEAQARGEP